MARDATKAAGNPWYEARIRASKYDERLRSREGAAELLGMSVSAVADAELDVSKVMPVDKAVRMADLYGAPQLLDLYCLRECPIGRNLPLSGEETTIERVTLKLVKRLNLSQIAAVKEKLVSIAEDGYVSEEEVPDLEEIMDYFDDVAVTLSELRTLGKTILHRARKRNAG